MKFRCTRLSSLVLGTLLVAGAAHADEIVLKNGQVLQGEILERNERSIKLQTATNTMTMPMDRVAEVRPSPPGASQLLRSRESLRARKFTEARNLAQTARERGAPAADVDAVLQEIDEAQRQQELARYSQLIAQARTSAAAGRDDAALLEIRKVIDTLPADSPSRAELTSILCEFHLARANEHRDRVRTVEAVKELEEVIKLDPNRSRAYLDLADVYKVTSTTHDKAMRCYQKVIELADEKLSAKETTRAHWELAELYRQRSKWREASFHYRTVFQRAPDFSLQTRDRMLEAFRAYAAEVEGADPAMALRVTEEALKIRRDADTLYRMGTLLNRLDRPDDSNTVLVELEKLDPRRANVHYMMAQNYVAMGEIIKGREQLRREIEVNPSHFESHVQLGDLALQRDDYKQAEEFYLAAKKLNPDDPGTSLGLGKVYRMRAKNANDEKRAEEAKEFSKKAREYVDQVLQIDVDNLEANLEMGRILIDEEDLNKAKDFFTKVLELVEKNRKEAGETNTRLEADALIARGEINLLTAGPGTANKDFRAALDVLPDYGQAYYSIGIAYRKKFSSSKQVSDLKEAETNLKRSRDLEKENPQYALELGILYSQHLARADKANEKMYLDQAIANWQDYIKLGGANTGTVERWISEITGTGPR